MRCKCEQDQRYFSLSYHTYQVGGRWSYTSYQVVHTGGEGKTLADHGLSRNSKMLSSVVEGETPHGFSYVARSKSDDP